MAGVRRRSAGPAAPPLSPPYGIACGLQSSTIAHHQRLHAGAGGQATLEWHRADVVGYHRYWLAEHHAMKAWPIPVLRFSSPGRGAHQRIRHARAACCCPITARSRWRSIPIRSAFPGPHRSRYLAGTGWNLLTARAMTPTRSPARTASRRGQETIGFLDTAAARLSLPRRQAMPAGPTSPKCGAGILRLQWVWASYLGLRFSFAHFITPHAARLEAG